MSTQRAILEATTMESMGRPKGSQQPRLTRGQDGYWRFRAYIDVRVDTKIERRQKTYVVGNMDGKRAAERRMKEILLEIDNRPRVIQAQTPMAVIFDAFEKVHLPTLRDNSQVQYRSVLKRLRARFSHLPAYQCNTQEIQIWVNELSTSLRYQSIRSYCDVLRSVFRCAQDWLYIDENQKNPVERVRIRSVKPKRELPALTIDQIRRLLAVADTTSTEFGLAVRIGIYCGLRVSEILFLQWKHVQPKMLVVAGGRDRRKKDGDTKSYAGQRVVPLGPVDLRRPEGASLEARVFPSLEYRSFKRELDRAMKAAGIPHIEGDGPHTLRRTHATHMDALGAANLDEQMGHSDERITQMYVRDTFVKHARALDKFADLVIGEGRPN